MIYLISLIAVILGVSLDQYTKYLANTNLKDHTIVVIDGIFSLELLPGGNEGGAWGIFEGHMWFLILVSLVAVAAICIMYKRIPFTSKYIPLRICLVSIVTGACGNMIDRIAFGTVTDFLKFTFIDFPTFNVADIFASVATCVLILLLLFYYKEQDFDVIYNSLKWQPKKKQESNNE